MLFDKTHFGKPISAELSALLTRYCGTKDFATAAGLSGISVSSVRDVVYQRNTLTENNSEGIIALCRIAFRKIMETVTTAKDDQDYLIEELKLDKKLAARIRIEKLEVIEEEIA